MLKDNTSFIIINIDNGDKTFDINELTKYLIEKIKEFGIENAERFYNSKKEHPYLCFSTVVGGSLYWLRFQPRLTRKF